jgi:hypothetical protein
MKDEDVAYYVKAKKLSVEDVVTTKKEVTTPELVVLPENPTVETLKPLTVKVLRLYCKQKEISIPAKTDEDGVIELILASLAPKE